MKATRLLFSCKICSGLSYRTPKSLHRFINQTQIRLKGKHGLVFVSYTDYLKTCFQTRRIFPKPEKMICSSKTQQILRKRFLKNGDKPLNLKWIPPTRAACAHTQTFPIACMLLMQKKFTNAWPLMLQPGTITGPWRLHRCPSFHGKYRKPHCKAQPLVAPPQHMLQ